jgi:diketogulonate reductase-like aldo/keto reductase
VVSVEPTLALNNGVAIPRVGLGVYQAGRGEETRRSVLDALALGYRHVDTARVYGNEADVGAAIRESGIPRDAIFVTTKLWNADQGYDAALQAFDASLQRLGLGYVDLYLIHWPVAGQRKESWRALRRIYEEKRARAIGVSNYMVRHLDEIADSGVVPAVNQIEVTPFFQQRDVRKRCSELGIAVEAYSPLTRGQKLSDPTVRRVAEIVGKTPAQVLIRWGLEHGMISLPKSVHAKRIAENIDVLDWSIAPSELAMLDGLEAGLATGWDPRRQP